MADRTGKTFERTVSEWLKEHMGYTKTRRRSPVKGKIADRHYDVDIHAVKFSQIAHFVFRAGIFLALISFFTAISPKAWPEATQFIEAIFTAVGGRVTEAGAAGTVVGIAALVLGLWAKKQSIKHAWVECKDLKGKVKRAVVQKLAASVDDVRNSEEAKWYPDIVMIFSRNGFDADALNFAKEHNIQCYEQTGDTFDRVL
jgi:hypothetical protein